MGSAEIKSAADEMSQQAAVWGMLNCLLKEFALPTSSASPVSPARG